MCRVKPRAPWPEPAAASGMCNEVRCQQTRKCSRNQMRRARPLSTGTSKAILVSRLSHRAYVYYRSAYLAHTELYNTDAMLSLHLPLHGSHNKAVLLGRAHAHAHTLRTSTLAALNLTRVTGVSVQRIAGPARGAHTALLSVALSKLIHNQVQQDLHQLSKVTSEALPLLSSWATAWPGALACAQRLLRCFKPSNPSNQLTRACLCRFLGGAQPRLQRSSAAGTVSRPENASPGCPQQPWSLRIRAARARTGRGGCWRSGAGAADGRGLPAAGLALAHLAHGRLRALERGRHLRLKLAQVE